MAVWRNFMQWTQWTLPCIGLEESPGPYKVGGCGRCGIHSPDPPCFTHPMNHSGYIYDCVLILKLVIGVSKSPVPLGFTQAPARVMQTHCCHQLLKAFIASKEGEKICIGGAGGLILGWRSGSPKEYWHVSTDIYRLHIIYIDIHVVSANSGFVAICLIDTRKKKHNNTSTFGKSRWFWHLYVDVQRVDCHWSHWDQHEKNQLGT